MSAAPSWACSNWCRWCEEGNPRIRSSVSDAFVHTDTPVGRVACARGWYPRFSRRCYACHVMVPVVYSVQHLKNSHLEIWNDCNAESEFGMGSRGNPFLLFAYECQL
jgi:hypothetical protein